MPFPQIIKEVGISLSAILRAKNNLKEQGHVKHKPGSGRELSAVTPRLVRSRINRNPIKSWINSNPIRSMRGMAKDLNVPEATTRRVNKKNIGARSLARIKKFLLADHLKVLRLEHSKKLLYIPTLLFLDEKYFSVDSARNSQTDCFTLKKNAKEVPDAIRSFQNSKHPVQVMVFGLIDFSGEKIPPVFLMTGLRKLNIEADGSYIN